MNPEPGTPEPGTNPAPERRTQNPTWNMERGTRNRTIQDQNSSPPITPSIVARVTDPSATAQYAFRTAAKNCSSR